MTYILRTVLALAALAGAAAAAFAQVDPAPPQVRLWRMEANGDAVQTDLGFILPARWQGFEREGFTSTRPDGASVAAHYRRADGPLRLRILIQLRGDVRGIPLPGADGVERNWRFIQLAAEAEYFGRAEGRPDELAGERIVWGSSRRPNARMQLRRYRLAGGAEIQGVWYRNIGLWAVMVAVSGPEARRTDIEAAGRSAMTGIEWPGAPLNAELRAIAPTFLSALPDCADFGRDGAGRAVDSGILLATMIGTALSANFLDTALTLPHPVLDPSPYCRIETFQVAGREMVALGWRGDIAGTPAARYAFMLEGTATFFQIESFFTIESLPADQRRGISRLVWLTGSNERQVAAVRVFTDWPSYAETKALVIETVTNPPLPVVNVVHPPGQIRVTPRNVGDTSVPPPPSP